MKSAIVCAVGALLVLGDTASAVDQARSSVEQQRYVWHGQFVTVDQTARDATFNARIPPHVERYVGRFKPGDRLMLVWNMVGKTEADDVLALWQLDSSKRSGESIGYVLPIEFVSADASVHTLTFKASLNSEALRSLSSVTPGRWIKVQSPMEQSPHGALITSIELAAPPRIDAGTSAP